MAALTVEDVLRGAPASRAPTSLKFAPDGSVVAFLIAETPGAPQSLHAMNPATGYTGPYLNIPAASVQEAASLPLSLEERLRRERAREVGHGITQYQWAASAPVAIVIIRSSIWLQPPPSREAGGFGVAPLPPAVLVVPNSAPSPVTFPEVSACGGFVSFCRAGEVWAAAATADATPWQVTAGSDGSPLVQVGAPEFIAQEEMDRHVGMWWSPDSAWLAACRVDERRVGVVRIPLAASPPVPAPPATPPTGRTSWACDPPPGWAGAEGREEEYRYPLAGGKNAEVDLGVVAVGPPGTPAAEPEWVLRRGEFEYIARVAWLGGPSPVGGGGGQLLATCVQDRRQSFCAVLAFAPPAAAGAGWVRRFILRDDAPRISPAPGGGAAEVPCPWINLHNAFLPCPAAPDAAARGAVGLLWASEAGGTRQLVRVDVLPLAAADAAVAAVPDAAAVGAGVAVAALTPGPAPIVDSLGVRGVVVPPPGADGGVANVVFTGTGAADVTQQHVWRCALHPAASPPPPPEQLTWGEGMWGGVPDPTGRLLAATFSCPTAPAVASLIPLPPCGAAPAAGGGGEPAGVVPIARKEPDARLRTLGLEPPEFLTCVAADGVTPLHLALHAPNPAVFPPPWPLAVHVYGGPHVQRVARAWEVTADMRAQLLRRAGCAVLRCDNRGSSRRGVAFEAAIAGRLGVCEIADQAAAVAALAARGLVDAERVAIYGWSYGGYLSALALCLAPSVFRAAVAGAPVVHWDGYDTHYTERYMGLPWENARGYETTAVTANVAAIPPGHQLMVVHGTLDENVHFRHSLRLIGAMVDARRAVQAVVVPDERHCVRGAAKRELVESQSTSLLLSVLIRNPPPPPPPAAEAPPAQTQPKG